MKNYSTTFNLQLNTLQISLANIIDLFKSALFVSILSIVFWLLARYIAMVFICVVQCRVVEYLLISKDNDDQIVTVNIVAESAVQWLVQLPPALYSPLTE